MTELFLTPILGVFVQNKTENTLFTDEPLCKHLSIEAPRYNLEVVVLTPTSRIVKAGSAVTGYCYHLGQWKRCIKKLPTLVWNRCLKSTISSFNDELKHVYKITPHWSTSLPNKWRVYCALQKNKHMTPYLPLTILLNDTNQWLCYLTGWQDGFFIKPTCGSHGQKTYHVMENNKQNVWIIKETRLCKQPFVRLFHDREDIVKWLKNLSQQQSFIIQPYLNLNYNSCPFDVRVLMQKNENGKWSFTGSIVREGLLGTLTSNLSGGGKAIPALTFLNEVYGEAKAQKISAKIKELSFVIPTLLEQNFGRFGELGLDFGVDPIGQTWLLEVNSKPGRKGFFMAGTKKSTRHTITKPLSYARYLLQQKVSALPLLLNQPYVNIYPAKLA